MEMFALVDSHYEMEHRQGLGKSVEHLLVGKSSGKYNHTVAIFAVLV